MTFHTPCSNRRLHGPLVISPALTYRSCDASRATTGVERYKLSIRLPGGGILRGPTSHAQRVQVARMLDHELQQSSASGLGALIMAVRAVSNNLPDGQQLSFVSKGQGDITLSAGNPALSVQACFRGFESLLRDTLLDGMLRVHVYAKCSEMSPTACRGQSFPVHLDLAYLEGTTKMVIQRISDAMSFDERESFAQTIAQSLLRVLRFRTPGLDIDRIRVKAYSSIKKKSILHVNARWGNAESGMPAEYDRLSHPVELDVEEYPADQTTDKRDNDQTREEHSKFFNKITEPRISNPEPKHEEISPDARPLQLASAPPDGREVQFVSAKIQ